MVESRKLITATLFGVVIAVVKGPFQPPYADFLIIVEAPILGLSFLLLGKGGATYTEVVNGLLQSGLKASFFPFSLIIAVMYGVLVDLLGTAFKAKRGDHADSRLMVLTLGIASVITGLTAAYTSIALKIIPYDPNLFWIVYVPIIIWGILSGALGGYISARLWERNLKARFRSIQPPIG
ncbi:MAG: hypothetical protein ACLQEQ_03315 [Nitrososphaerales archaeon]